MLNRLRPLEYAVLTFYGFLSALNLINAQRIPGWGWFIILNAVIITGILVLGKYILGRKSRFAKIVAWWYPAPLVLITFKEIYFLIHSIRGTAIYDDMLIRFDFALFGFHPTVALSALANPVLTELLQLAYASFYFLPMILAAGLYFDKKVKEAEYVIFAVVFGFFVSYVGYFLLPAVGPRFTLHDFYLTDAELPGLFFTKFIRDILNTGESIPPGTTDAIARVQRDVFPSGHTMMTAMVMYLAIKFKARYRTALIITGALLILATVYLRYHYVADVLAGLVFLVFSLWAGRLFYNRAAKTNGFEIIT